jgi:hypothetical protein
MTLERRAMSSFDNCRSLNRSDCNCLRSPSPYPDRELWPVPNDTTGAALYYLDIIVVEFPHRSPIVRAKSSTERCAPIRRAVPHITAGAADLLREWIAQAVFYNARRLKRGVRIELQRHA